MKRTQSFSIYALLIALLVHFIIILLLILLDQFKPKLPLAKPSEPREERFRLSLKERPNITKEAIVKNDIPKPPTKLPIPRGEQLLKPSKRVPAPPVKQPISEPTPTPIEPKKAYEPHVAKIVATIEKTPIKKEQGLYDILSRPDPSAQEKPSQSTTKITDTIQRLYGDKFNELSEGEQRYIIDNQEAMRRITQGVLDRYGHSRIPDNIRTNDTNMIEFYLHPDGSISDLHFLKNSQLSILDDTTKEVIELAYAKYPRPQQKTLIRYRVWYNLTGY
jgi:outer membrane biosynthesis protein TonB